MATDKESGFELDNEKPEHRTVLIAALLETGFDAYEYNSGGGVMHVVVDLYNDQTGITSDCLMIATGSVTSPCDVSLMGWRNGSNVWYEEWTGTSTVNDAVAVFRRYWDERKVWLDRFEQGELEM